LGERAVRAVGGPPAPYGHGTLTYGCARHGIKRWWLYLTQEQAASVAYGVWLHRMAGSAAEAIRASPGSTASCTARRGTWAREFRPRGVERGPVSEYDVARPAGAGAEGFGECGHKRRAARWRTPLVSWSLLVNLPLELARRGAISCTLRRRRVCRRFSCSGVRVAFGEFVGSRNRQVTQQAGLGGVSRLE
jgi:hypothetical protein